MTAPWFAWAMLIGAMLVWLIVIAASIWMAGRDHDDQP